MALASIHHSLFLLNLLSVRLPQSADYMGFSVNFRVQGRILRALLKVHWRRLVRVGILEVGSCLFMLLSPYLLQQLLLALQQAAPRGVHNSLLIVTFAIGTLLSDAFLLGQLAWSQA